MTATYENIATTTLTTTTSTITFNSIPSTYTDLRLIWVINSVTANAQPIYYFNDVTLGNLYSLTNIQGNGSTIASQRGTNQNQLTAGFSINTSTTIPCLTIIDVFNYAGSTNKTSLYRSHNDRNGSGSIDYGVGLYRSTSAITRIDIGLSGSNMASGTTATLYGIKAE